MPKLHVKERVVRILAPSGKMVTPGDKQEILVPSYTQDDDYSPDFLKIDVSVPDLLTTRTTQMYFKRPGFRPQFRREATNGQIKFDCTENTCYLDVTTFDKDNKKLYRLTLDLPCSIMPETKHSFWDVKDGCVSLYLCKKTDE